jgi:hypothetical protein
VPQAQDSPAVTVARMASAGVAGIDRNSTAGPAGGSSSSARRLATLICISASLASMAVRWEMISLVLVSRSGACSTALTWSSGISRSRKRRMTWATGTWAGS